MRAKGYSLRAIAKVLERGVSTLSEEIGRNATRGTYHAKKAHHKAYVRRKYAKYQGMKIVGNAALRSFVEAMLMDDQSPEAIAGRIAHKERQLPVISKESIYRYLKSVYGRAIAAVRRRHKRRRARQTMSALSERTFIDKRPADIEARQRVGDVEADFVVSGKQGEGVVLVVVDRKLRVVFLERIVRVSIDEVHRAFLRVQERFPELKTITTDNDILFARHKELARLLGVTIYFCHAYHAWEKGSVENANKYLRRYIAKGSDISGYSQVFLASLEAKLNRRAMKCLGYATPQEALEEARKKALTRFPHCSD